MSLTSAQKKSVRAEMVRYLRRCIKQEPRIHYSMNRPIDSFMDMPEEGFTTDCSGLVISTFRWARVVTGILLPDPSGYGYKGWGNTESLRDPANGGYKVPPPGGIYFVGDMAHYDGVETNHVAICMKNGDRDTSEWCSHGWEGGPQKVKLHYRPLAFVLRAHSLR